jgi:hypothetical protein
MKQNINGTHSIVPEKSRAPLSEVTDYPYNISARDKKKS